MNLVMVNYGSYFVILMLDVYSEDTSELVTQVFFCSG